MISKEEENKTRQVRENLRNQKSLYDTFKDVYDKAKPVSRILMMLKIVQVVDPQQKRKDKEKEKELNKDTIPNFINELKENLNKLNLPSNIMLIFVGTGYCFLGLENTTENIMDFVKIYRARTKMVENAHIITFNEECPNSSFPVFYKYYFCNLGKNLKSIIRSEADFKTNNSQVVKEENNFVKYLPTSNEIECFEGKDFMDIDTFSEMYLDELKIEFDSDVIYPYYWPINA